MPSPRPIKPLRYRQIHLDFHTSEHIPGIGAEFDPVDFVETLRAAHVNSITIFAKCHHGWSYYPTNVGAPHPGLARPDLLGDMVKALKAADIEAPIYITVQWDERTAREHPEWRVMSATNRFHHALPADPSSAKQLSPAWHTICLNHEGYRQYVLDQAREVASRYDPPGIFFDIVGTQDCVCPACISRMLANNLDPEKPADRLKNDEAVNEHFRQEISGALFQEFPGLRVFYNFGHVPKKGRKRLATYTHIELESLPTGGWGYDHFPPGARYAATLGMDFLAHTGKFHTSWGEFGGFKQAEALDFECAQMVSLGSKCLVGDQLHPSGAINHDTYKSIAPAYDRIQRLEPFLEGAKQVSEIAILSAEYFSAGGGRNHPSDDGAAQMLQELKRPFDVIDEGANFEAYRLLILPDEIPVAPALAARLKTYVGQGGKIIASWHAGLDANGAFAIDAGLARSETPVAFRPSYIKAKCGAGWVDARDGLRHVRRSRDGNAQGRHGSGRDFPALLQSLLQTLFFPSAHAGRSFRQDHRRRRCRASGHCLCRLSDLPALSGGGAAALQIHCARVAESPRARSCLHHRSTLRRPGDIDPSGAGKPAHPPFALWSASGAWQGYPSG